MKYELTCSNELGERLTHVIDVPSDLSDPNELHSYINDWYEDNNIDAILILYRSLERIKATGEVFTPLPLVNEILSRLPAECWLPEKKFLDNSCGDGNFLVCVLGHKHKHGSSVIQALSTIYGVDLMPDNVMQARHRLLSLARELDYNINMKEADTIVFRNIVCHDALTYDYSFGNPQDNLVDIDYPKEYNLLT